MLLQGKPLLMRDLVIVEVTFSHGQPIVRVFPVEMREFHFYGFEVMLRVLEVMW